MNLLLKLFGTCLLLFWLPLAVLAFCPGEWAKAMQRVWMLRHR